MKRILLAICLLGAGCGSEIKHSRDSDTVAREPNQIGRWCDEEWNDGVVYEISKTDGGDILLHRRHDGDQASQTNLLQAGGGIYLNPSSEYGEYYSVVASTGDLEMFDREGFIRTLRYLAEGETSQHCR